MMTVEKLSAVLWWWTAAHPAWRERDAGPDGWPQRVGSGYVETRDGVALLDPLVPAETDGASHAKFLQALDADVERVGGSLAIVISVASHGRSADLLRRRYSHARTFAHAGAVGHVSAEITDPFAGERTELPGGLVAHRLAMLAGGECVIELPGGQGLFFGDTLLGSGDGRCRLSPPSWAGGPEGLERTRIRLLDLLDLRFERLLTSHGPPVLSDASRALRDALAAPKAAV